VRRFAWTSLLFAALQQLGSMSPSLQRMLIHILQPIVLGAFFYLGVLLSGHPLSFIGVGALCLGLVAYIANSIRKDRLEDAEAPQSVIVPKITPDPKDSLSSSSPPPAAPSAPDSSSLHSPMTGSGARKGSGDAVKRLQSSRRMEMEVSERESDGDPVSSSQSDSLPSRGHHFQDNESLDQQSDSSNVGSMNESFDQLDDFLRTLHVVDHGSRSSRDHGADESDSQQEESKDPSDDLDRDHLRDSSSGDIDDESSLEEVDVGFAWNESSSSGGSVDSEY
jgi:hypothetical protein